MAKVGFRAATTTSDTDVLFSSNRVRLPDDTVFYSIFPDFTVSPSTAQSTSEMTAHLHSLHLQLLNSISTFTSSYIWQHEPFTLSLSSQPGTSTNSRCPCSVDGPNPVPLHLHGKLRFGDNLDDEWFVVFLLFHLSITFPLLSIRVWDSDGEFLLIEAAFHLPRWLNPETTPNRVFIRNGQLHIIPKRRFPSIPNISDALFCLITNGDLTRASESIQSAVKVRVSEYPEKARRNLHRVRVRIPVSVARVLKDEPCLISLAVEGFYDRDIDAMKFAAKMERFCEKGREEELVVSSVVISRAMYAQLIQQKFQAPKCYPMPGRGDRTAFIEAELGMKIACGVEMMYQQRKKEGEEGKGRSWEVFVESLEKNGYFQGLIPGSQEYKRLMANAEEYYRKSSLYHSASEVLSAPVRRIDEILALPYSAEDFKGQDVPPSDDDSWLYGGEDELNAALMERQKEMELYEQKRNKRNDKGKGVDDGFNNSEFKKNPGDLDLGDIAKSMQDFMGKVSGYQGAEVPDNRNLQDVDFDVDRFMKELESVVGMDNGDHEGSDDDDSGEGTSSDMDFDASEEGSDSEDEHPQQDSNNPEGNEFMNTYNDVLNEELKGSTLKKSFVKATDPSSKKQEGTSEAAAEDMEEDDFTPVDVDVNLVKSLLDSFSSQQGLPGPASNLLGLMGKQLPKDYGKAE